MPISPFVRSRGQAPVALAALAAVTLDAQAPDTTTDVWRHASRRFAFAESYVALDAYQLGTATLPGDPGNRAATIATPRSVSPRLSIGAMHFWGHADLHVSFVPGANARRALDETDRPNAALRPGLETGVRVYPLALRPDGIPRPFVGIGFQRLRVARVGAAGEGADLALVRFPMQVGFAARRRNLIVQAGAHAITDRDFRYAIEPGMPAAATLPRLALWFGVQRTFETTRQLTAQVADGREAAREQRLRAAGQLRGPYVGIGASTATMVGGSGWNRAVRPELGVRLPGAIFPELALGWEDPDRRIALQLMGRRWTLAQEAYGLRQSMSRASVAVELLRFLGDYHGFVPYVGVALGGDRLRLTESWNADADTTGRAAAQSRAAWHVVPGAVIGWDIRPRRTERIVLRTNLRLAPGARLAIAEGRAASFAHLEFNFIQVVWYPRR